jgi:hypothetical protein
MHQISKIYFVIKLHVSGIFCAHHQELSTAHSAIGTLFCHKTLHASGIFRAHHQELSAVRTAIGTFHAGYVSAS